MGRSPHHNQCSPRAAVSQGKIKIHGQERPRRRRRHAPIARHGLEPAAQENKYFFAKWHWLRSTYVPQL